MSPTLNENKNLPGITQVLEGFHLIFKPGIRQYVIIPLLINILLFGLLLFTSYHYVHTFNVWLAAHLPHWLAWLGWVIWIVFFLSFFVIFIYAFTTISNLISTPFNSLLAEKVEFYLTGIQPPSSSMVGLLKDIPRELMRQLSVLGYYIPRALGILILFFIPLVHLLVPFLWLLFNAWFMALQYLDYSADNHRVPMRELHIMLKERRWVALSFGAGVLLLSMVPFINFIAMPVAIAGGTKLWVEEFSKR